MKHETMYEAVIRKKNGPRKPLKTISEIAVIVQATKMELAKILSTHNGPKPIMRNGGNNGNKNTWYDPEEVIKFVKKLKDSPTEHCNRCGKDKPKEEFYKLTELTFRRPCKQCSKEIKQNKDIDILPVL